MCGWKRGGKPVLGSFKTRLLVVIVIITLVGYSLQSGYGSRTWIEPVLRMVFYEDQWANRLVAAIGEYLPGYQTPAVVSDQFLQLPCAYTGIIRSFGSTWDVQQEEPVLFPGVILQVDPNTVVRPVLAGKVILVEGEGSDYKVVVRHEGGLGSEYGKLAGVKVKTGMNVNKGTILGRCDEEFYFAINSPEGPLDPGQLFP